jgi:hypothetical protein
MPGSIKSGQVFLQEADYGLEVAVAEAAKRPTSADMRKAWKARHGGRPSPVLLAVGYPGADGTAVAVCGPVGEDPPVHFDLEPSRVERLAATALAEPTRHAAQRCLLRLLPEVESELPGLVNSGLLATQELRHGVPQRRDWPEATKASQPALKKRGRSLIEALGFTVTQLGANTSLLMAGVEHRAVAVFLDQGETFDAPGARFEGVSPVSHALAVAEREHLSWVVLTRASEIRLYAARPDTGVGRRGPSQTFIEANVALLPDDLAGYLQLLFSADALADGGTFEQILSSSADFAADLASRLRERVYREAVPTLAQAIAARLDPHPDEAILAASYDQTLNILFRLLFVAYGEDKDLLPYDTNSRYADHSLKRIARRLGDDMNRRVVAFEKSAADLWEDVVQIWTAVDRGNKSWGVPPYNGGLFSADRDTNPAGAALAKLRLTNAEFGPALAALLVDTGDGTFGPVDFRSLSVREFGTIYEGLLESELSKAPSDLTLDSKGTYVPATGRQKVVVSAGAVYLHNRSGARKATGSYFTKPFAVEHLLDHALEPALADHLARIQVYLDAGDDAAAATAFFDFRCADIAMGSGHFLVAAVDRIEARLSAFLALHPIPAVTAELDRLRTVAIEALGDLADGYEIETSALLRRQVGRRCIYGVDRNEIAVELARLAIWIHTFVPGLPLSFLDHNLVVGDSLIGIGSIDMALAELEPQDPSGTASLWRDEIQTFLDRASAALRRLATITDATVADVKAARAAHLEALEKVAPATALFDLLVAARLGKADVPLSVDEERVVRDAKRAGACDVVTKLRALHFPVAFPEVFLRVRPGFDCILGNPPWEEVMVDEHTFWAAREPGVRSLPAAAMKREIAKLRRKRPDWVAEYESEVDRTDRLRQLLSQGQFPQMNEGNADLYKAFCWRFWQLIREDGAVGVVLPRTALSGKGTSKWRTAILQGGSFADVTLILNNMSWAFDDVHAQYTFGLVALRKGDAHVGAVNVRGPFSNLLRFRQGVSMAPASFPVDEFLTWSEAASFPSLPSADATAVFQKLRAHTSLGLQRTTWRARPIQGDFNATTDKGLFILDEEDAPDDAWPVYKGASFNLWEPDTGTYYAWADPELVTSELQRRRAKGQRSAKSAFSEFSRQWATDPGSLPCWYPRLAFRDVTNRTNTRTVIAALVPGEIVISNQAPYVLWPRGGERDQAFLLGVLCSMPLDWYARRVVETHVNFHLFNAFPVPDPGRDHPLRRRVEEVAGRLAAVEDWCDSWAKAVGVPIASVSEADKPHLIAELDAAVAVLYGLDEGDLRVIYDTFHEGADYSAHCDRVIAHYRRLS